MKNVAFFLLIMLILAAFATPYADGWLVKRALMLQIQRTQALLDSQQANMQIQVTSYKIGWLQSTATISMSGTFSNKTGDTEEVEPVQVNIPVNLVIHHGPVVLIDNKPVTGLAYIESFIHLPDNWQRVLPNGNDMAMKISSLMTLDGQITTSNLSIPPITTGAEFKWEGLTGNSTLTMNGNEIQSVKNNMTIGRINGDIAIIGGSYTIDPINSESSITISSDDNKMSTITIKSGSMNVNIGGSNIAKLQSWTVNSTNTIKSGMYDADFATTFNNLQVTSFDPVSSISLIKYTFNVKNLNSANMRNFSALLHEIDKKYKGSPYTSKTMSASDQKQIQDAFTSIVNAKSTLETTFSTITNQGNASLLVNLSLNNTPKQMIDFPNMLDGKLELRISKPLMNLLIKAYVTYTISMQAMRMPAPATPATNTIASKNKNLYAQAVANLVMNQAITTDQSMVLMGIPDQHPASEADLDKILAKLALPKPTNDSLKALYMTQYIAMQAPPQVIPAIPEPALAQKIMLDNLVSQRILIEAGDEYTLSVTKSGTTMTVNGSSDNQHLQIWQSWFNSLFSGTPATTSISNQTIPASANTNIAPAPAPSPINGQLIH